MVACSIKHAMISLDQHYKIPVLKATKGPHFNNQSDTSSHEYSNMTFAPSHRHTESDSLILAREYIPSDTSKSAISACNQAANLRNKLNARICQIIYILWKHKWGLTLLHRFFISIDTHFCSDVTVVWYLNLLNTSKRAIIIEHTRTGHFRIHIQSLFNSCSIHK